MVLKETDFNQLINTASESFNQLKEDLLSLEESYFREPFNRHKISAKIDYREAARLLRVARNLGKLNIRLNKLYEDFRSFVGKNSDVKTSGISGSDTKVAGMPWRMHGSSDKNASLHMHIPGSTGLVGSATGYVDGHAGNADGYAGHADHTNGYACHADHTDGHSAYVDGYPGFSSTGYSDESSDIYNDFIFGLKQKIPLAFSSELDLQAKQANVNITKEMFRKIIFEILDYEKNYNKYSFSPSSLYSAVKTDVINNGREVLLPYVISNVLTYLKDSNFVGQYGTNKKSAYTVLDRDGLKLWADSIL